MPVTPAQQRIISGWNDRTAYLMNPCPACQADTGFNTGEIISAPLVDAYGNIVTGTLSVPMITFECDTCGYLLMFNAYRIPDLI